MKRKRGLTYYRPLDKTISARRRPDGARGISSIRAWREDQVVANTRWLAENLKKFGCRYVQIDDGWQGVGRGMGENRNWYVTEKQKFPHGMKWLADTIRGGLQARHLADPLYHERYETLSVAAGPVPPPPRRNECL